MGFKNFIAKYFRRAVIISVISAVCAALLVSGGLLLTLKLLKLDIDWWYYLLAGVGAAVLVGLPVFLLTRPNDVKIAKKLDSEFNLNQRIQTMVEYGGKDDVMSVLQREDAEEKLSAIPKRKLTFIGIAKLCVLPVIAVALFFTGVFYPVDKTPVGTDDPDFTVPQWYFGAVENLISDIENSTMSEAPKQKTVEVLNGLTEGMSAAKSQSALNNAARGAMQMISEVSSSSNSYFVIGTEIRKSELIKDIGTSILKCSATYNSGNKKLTSSCLNNDNKATISTAVGGLLNGVTVAVNEGVRKAVEEGSLLDFTPTVKKYTAALTKALEDSFAAKDKAWTEEDALYTAVKAYIDGLATVCKKYDDGGMKVSWYHEQIALAGTTFESDGQLALSEQTYTRMTCAYARQTLADIFGLSYSGEDDEFVDDATDPNDPSHSGGGGDKDVIYGSDDIIYYPNGESGGQYVPYGEVLNEYYAKVVAYLQSEDISDEMKKSIQDYFDILFSGPQE